jgi:GH15 family glucan-1,4-alpha-glucosidase
MASKRHEGDRACRCHQGDAGCAALTVCRLSHERVRELAGELVSDSLVYRYDPSASPDGLRGHEGTFSICTFWYVDALARSGRLEQARMAFEKMFTYANHLGLYAEEIGQTGEQLGNFPQAFTHLSLINAAINLDYQLDHGAGIDPVLQPGADGVG